MTIDYIPSQDAAKIPWALNLQTQSGQAVNSTAMGWSGPDVAEVNSQAQVLLDALLAKDAAKAAYKSAVAGADASIKGALKILRQQIGSGKKEPTYTLAVGQALRVVGEGAPFDPAAYVGELKGLTLLGPAQVQVAFGKASGQIDGVKVAMRRAGQTVWLQLSFDTESPYVDTTPLAVPGTPEVREYQVRGVLHDEEIGQPSAAQSVTVT